MTPGAAFMTLRQLNHPWRLRRIAGDIVVVAAIVATVAGCTSLSPIEKLVVDRDGGALLAQIRAGEVGIDEPLPWGGLPGMSPSYFTPLCAAAFGGAAAVMDELLALGADVNVECGASQRPLDLAQRHRNGPVAEAMSQLLGRYGVAGPRDDARLVQARL
jgi:hypothetical protein